MQRALITIQYGGGGKKNRQGRISGGPGPRGSGQRKGDSSPRASARPTIPAKEHTNKVFRGTVPTSHDKGSGEGPLAGLSIPICTVEAADWPLLLS